MIIHSSDNNGFNQKNVQVAKGLLFTPQWTVHLEGPVTGEYLSRLKMQEDLNNFRSPLRQHEALISISKLPNGKVFIARNEDTIIGYVTFHHPDEYSRWYSNPYVLELGAIEITKKWRKYKIAYHLLQEIFCHSFAEDFIIMSIEYCWHWDLKGSEMSIWDYQKMLTKLFSSVGLKKRATDDPDILEHPANVLMVRSGSNVPKEAIQRFEELTFKGK